MKSFPSKIIALIFLLSFSAFAQNINSNVDSNIKPNNEPVPVLVLSGPNVWAKVYGTEMPDFVLYDDGTIIYEPKDAGYVTARLSSDEVNQLMEKINASEFEDYKNHYSICEECYTVDLPSRFIMFKRKDGTYKTVSTYGMLGEKAQNEYRVQDIPKTLVNTFHFLYDYETPKAETWKPDFIEVIVWKYDGESKKSIKWNRKLPDLNDSKTVAFKQSETQYYSLFVPESLERTLGLNLYKLRKSKGALLMNGQRWNLTYRFPFPSERVWLADKDGKIFRDEK